jgi:hypothetical protein
MKASSLSLLALFLPSVAAAHIGISPKQAPATTNQVVTFAINHGCKIKDSNNVEHEYDTLSVQIDIPAAIDGKTVRVMPVEFAGAPVVTRDGDGAVTSVKWTRDVADLQPVDGLGYYELKLKLPIPGAPFTAIPFVITQTCKDGNGDDIVVVWSGPSSNPEPSPVLYVTSDKHSYGWNKYTLTTPVANADFGKYFGDALIVWKGTSAFSPNMVVNTLIAATPGVTPLEADLAAGDEIWVKY